MIISSGKITAISFSSSKRLRIFKRVLYGISANWLVFHKRYIQNSTLIVQAIFPYLFGIGHFSSSFRIFQFSSIRQTGICAQIPSALLSRLILPFVPRLKRFCPILLFNVYPFCQGFAIQNSVIKTFIVKSV